MLLVRIVLCWLLNHCDQHDLVYQTPYYGRDSFHRLGALSSPAVVNQTLAMFYGSGEGYRYYSGDCTVYKSADAVDTYILSSNGVLIPLYQLDWLETCRNYNDSKKFRYQYAYWIYPSEEWFILSKCIERKLYNW